MVDISSDHYEIDLSTAKKRLGWTPKHSSGNWSDHCCGDHNLCAADRDFLKRPRRRGLGRPQNQTALKRRQKAAWADVEDGPPPRAGRFAPRVRD